MRVICIDDREQPEIFKGLPFVKKGNVYNVLDTKYSKEIRKDGIRYYEGNYYLLAECGGGVGYHESLFITINEDQQSEREMERNYNLYKEIV